ncbi:MAG: M3 family metallopeptidase [Candidatus Gracilibacteria bacterium]|nr:M3 family metallopeptidase [Candidatus Gracilibacteria bacterium]
MKETILKELENNGFPDLELLFGETALKSATETLDILLEKEKNNFEIFLKLPNEQITFESFDDDGILDYYWGLLHHYQNVNNTDEMRKIIDGFRPKMQDFGNYVAYNKNLYEKTLYCYEKTEINSDQKRALELRLKGFRDIGINLPEKEKEKLKKLNKIGGELSSIFSNNIVDDEALFQYHIENLECIKELPEDVLKSTKKLAEEKGKTGYLFDADPSSYMAIMKYCSESSIRQDFEKAQQGFASSGKYDNRETILKIIKNKTNKSQILGYNNAAEMSLNSKMADSPEQIFSLIEGISEKARTKALSEIKELEKYFNIAEIKSYDFAYYARKYKEEKFNLDEKELKKYFEFEASLCYLHDFTENFLGIKMKKIENIHNYNEDVQVYEVYRNEEKIAYYILDPYYRKEKRGGAWADNLREKSFVGGKTKLPIVVNVCNFLKSSESTLLSMRDVETLFHEFGHALHEMLSQSKLSELSGFNVEWDFVELPSQLLENWVTDRESLEKLGTHYQTGNKIPENLLNILENSKTFMKGNFILRQNELALLDMHLYNDTVPNNIEELDEKITCFVNGFGVIQRSPDYKMYCSFSHIFGGGYAAGYYSYMWAEILEADVFMRIKQRGMFDETVGKKLIDTLIGQGTRKPAGELFHDFMDREVDNTAFMERTGLL